jgi:3-oxoacyl-[acyl-carrier protein] reductase
VGGPPSGSFSDLNDADWHSAFENIMMSAVRLARLALPPMREHGWGRIVTITSSSGKEPIPGLMLSNAMRAGVAAIVKTLAREVAADGVTVNNVCPGMTDTQRLNELFAARAKKAGTRALEERETAIGRMPRGRFNSPEEFAAVVRFLCSEEASGVNGVSWFVDGAASASTF